MTKVHNKFMVLSALVAGALSLAAGAAESRFVRADSPDIVVEGRYAMSAADGVRLGFPGVVLHCRYHGDDLKMRVNAATDEVFFDVSVDDGKPVRLRALAGEHDYPIVEATAAGDHVVEITRRNESWQGTCVVDGFDPGPDGRLLSPPPLPARKLLFIGDSITCGANADYSPNDPLNGHTEHNTQWCDARVTFGKVLARHFHAQCHLVSYGGRGLIRDWQGLNTVCNAPQFYELALPDDPSIEWDHRRYVPDGVVICLGGNDFHSGVPDETVFVNAYVQFLEKIEHDAPLAWIFVMDCPMLKDEPGKPPQHSVLHAYLEEIVEKMHNPHIVLAPVSYYPGNPMDHHPTRANHAAIATELEPILAKDLGW